MTNLGHIYGAGALISAGQGRRALFYRVPLRQRRQHKLGPQKAPIRIASVRFLYHNNPDLSIKIECEFDKRITQKARVRFCVRL
jgi:hypothetical protein